MQSLIVKELCRELAGENPAVMVTVLRTHGSTPRKAGSQMLVRENGEIVGTIGGGLAEHQAMRLALSAFRTRLSTVHQVTMNASVAESDGMACGGEMEFFIQYISPGNR